MIQVHSEERLLILILRSIGSTNFQIPRKLLFHWGSNPSVSWDWWIDPDSSTYLVREEFKHTSILLDHWETPWDDWETIWPLWYPAWASHYGPWTYHNGSFDGDRHRKWYLIHERAEERANRRLRKKSMKAARAQGMKKGDRMPGAWPT